MTILMKAAVTGIGGAVLAMLLKKTAPELSLALGMAVCLAAAGLAMELVAGLTDTLALVREKTGLSSAVTGPVLKCVGAAVISRLSSDLCRDAGQTAVASAVELCGAVCALAAAMPLIRTLLEMIGELP